MSTVSSAATLLSLVCYCVTPLPLSLLWFVHPFRCLHFSLIASSPFHTLSALLSLLLFRSFVRIFGVSPLHSQFRQIIRAHVFILTFRIGFWLKLLEFDAFSDDSRFVDLRGGSSSIISVFTHKPAINDFWLHSHCNANYLQYFHNILKRGVSIARIYSERVESSSRDTDVRVKLLEGGAIYKAAPLFATSLRVLRSLHLLRFTFYRISIQLNKPTFPILCSPTYRNPSTA